MKYSCINIQGNFISEEVLQKIETASTDYQKNPTDFGFEPGTNLRDEIEYSWSRIKLDWKHFSEKSNSLPASDQYGTTIARKWMENFFSSIGFNLSKQKEVLTGDNNQSYSISHIDNNANGLPIHIVGFYDPEHSEKNTLDIKSSGGTSRLSPHGTVQEYLNVTEYVYGLASNGLVVRLIRDSGRLVKLTYVEFDLKRMLDEDKYSEFTLLYRLIHSSRFINEASIIEKYYQESIDSGNRIRDGLRGAVKESLDALGNGFIHHPANEELREKLRNKTISPKQYYDQLRRLVYRLLFLMVTEERDLIYESEDLNENILKQKEVYKNYYSIARLRKLSENRYLYEKEFSDLWQGLLKTFLLFQSNGNGIKIGIKPLGGDLFSESSIKDISRSQISNNILLECILKLNEFRDKGSKLKVKINYRSLDVEELGSVYEGLLELHPYLKHLDSTNPSNIAFGFNDEATDRKTTGSYYTRPDLVNELITSALIPVIEERVKEAGTEKKKRLNALLKLKVCDTAAGSGHIMLAAARTIGWYMARIDSVEDNPAPSVYRYWLRQAIQHCIYAVDLNPDAVELCKLAFWLEGHNNGKPLSFLDHKIRCGNSLVGVADLAVLKNGIPTEAFNPVTGDDKKVCTELKKENQKFLKFLEGRTDIGLQQGISFETSDSDLKQEQKEFANKFAELDSINQDTLEEVNEISKKHSELKYNPKLQKDKNACDLYTAAFFYTYDNVDDPAAPSSQKLKSYLQSAGGVEARAVGMANVIGLENNFFHWPLEFPDVFDQGGFDVVMGNPPWERIKLQEQEFFLMRDSSIAKARTAAERKSIIKNLPETNPELYKEYNFACHISDCTSKFIRESGRFPLTARGDINTYAIFAELFLKGLKSSGIASIIVPTGIATDSGTSVFFSTLMKEGKIKSLYDFVNEKMLFPDVLHNFHFSLFTVSAKQNAIKECDFSFNNQLIEHLQQDIRHFSLSYSEIESINPETKTLPVLTSKYDSEILLKVHQKNQILSCKGAFPDVWNVDLFSLFHMTNDSGLFLNYEQEGTIPLYEAKMFYLYDHRYGTYNDESDERLHMLPKTELHNYVNASFRVKSSFYIQRNEVLEKLKDKWNYKWFLAFRGISSGQLERTFTSSIIPFCGVGNSSILVNSIGGNSIDSGLLLSAFNSIPFDYVTRQKASGANLNFFKVRQLPLPSPKKLRLIQTNTFPKILELIYSSWDIKAYADDVWKEADEDLHNMIKAQWEENKKATGGHEWSPPVWCEIDEQGIELPPFKWDEERRAVLKAELDAIYAKLYGLTDQELRYILDPQDVYGEDFPGETFRVLKDKEIKKYGEYRTKRLVLEAWERMK